MELLKSHKQRSRLSEMAYIALNIAFAIALFAIVRAAGSVWLALLVVIISKWRALAVRPRFWWANLVANMVDIIVGVSVVVLLYAADGTLWLQAGITILYIVWLLFIKPRSKRSFVAVQAGVSLFVGTTALSIIAFAWDPFFFVIGMWGLGYVVSRHVLSSYEEPHVTLYSLIAGLVTAELAWIGFHWQMAYPIPGFGQIHFSQLALFLMLFGLVSERAYASYHKYGEVRRSDVILPILLTISVMIAVYVLALLYGSDAL